MPPPTPRQPHDSRLALLQAYGFGDQTGLHQTRELAVQAGALVTVAVMDLALSEIALASWDAAKAVDHGRRCVAASRRFGLATGPVASLWEAGGHALAGHVDDMEAAVARALAANPEDPRILGDVWGKVRAVRSMVLDDTAQLRRDLDEMMTWVRIAPITTSVFESRFIWALIHAAEDDHGGQAARAELLEATHLAGWSVFVRTVLDVDAIMAGRRGDRGQAADLMERSLAMSAARPDIASGYYARIIVAEAAVRDGWGNPVPWLPTKHVSVPFGDFSGADFQRIATTDTLTHAWDLAKATGQPTDLDPDLATRVLAAAPDLIPDAWRGDDPLPFRRATGPRRCSGRRPPRSVPRPHRLTIRCVDGLLQPAWDSRSVAHVRVRSTSYARAKQRRRKAREVERVRFGRSESEWAELVEAGKDFLIERARMQRTTSYTELNAALRNRTSSPGFDFSLDVDRAAIGELLGQISDAAAAETDGLLISALAQYLDANDAGPGFYALAKAKGLQVPSRASDRQLFWAAHVGALHDHYSRQRRR